MVQSAQSTTTTAASTSGDSLVRPQPSPDNLVWSPFHEIHQLAVKPVQALVNLVGSKETHPIISEIIQTGVRDIIQKQGAVTANYAPPSIRIQSFDLPSACPRAAKRNKGTVTTSDNGFLKRNFFKSFAYNKPAVTIFVFDWRDWAKRVPAGEQFEWKDHESIVLEQIKQHSAVWMKDLSVPSKYMIIILFPLAQPGQPISYNVDQCMPSFRRAVQLNGDENIKSSNYFLSNGFEGLKTGMMRKFVKNVHELVVSYYREKKNNIKRKQRKLIANQSQHIRYGMHSALYSLVTSNDFGKSIEKLTSAYAQLLSTQTKQSIEKRDNADILVMTIQSLYLQSNQLPKFIETYQLHFKTFQRDIALLKGQQRLEEMKWRSCWFHLIGQLLERYFKKQGGLQLINQRSWHTQHSLDFFPGHYFLNCMFQLIARQSELGKMKLDCLANGKSLYDHSVLESIIKTSNSFIGREYEVNDPQQPGRSLRNGELFEDALATYKLYEESQVQLGIQILTAGQIAIGYYRQRSQIIRGPSSSLYMRTVHMINYHLGELMDRHSNQEDEEKVSGERSKPLVSQLEKQKYRRQIQQSLIKEKWTKEAIALIEKSKTMSETLEDYFQNEMKILMNAHSLQNHKRHKRLMDLIEKVQNERLEDREPIKLTGVVTGTSLLWARARFEHNSIQINKFNKLTIEVFSRLSTPIKIAKLSIMMSQLDLSQEIDFEQDDNLSEKYYVLSKTNPIKLERQFYLNQEDDQIGAIMLNQILLELAPKKMPGIMELEEHATPPVQNKLLFSISPYLAPEESLLDLGGPMGFGSSSQKQSSGKRQVKRLPPPIMYTIEPLPQKVKVEALLTDAKDQALLGDPYDIKLRLTKLENVKLKKFEAVFIRFDAQPIGEEEAQHDGFSQVIDDQDMIEIGLSTHGAQTAANSNQSALSTSIFSPNMSQFYQNAKGLLSQSSINERNGASAATSSSFLGANPNIGVAVLKRSQTFKKAAGSLGTSAAAKGILDPVHEGMSDDSFDYEDVKPVELYYSTGGAGSDDLTQIVLDNQLDDQEEQVVSLLNEQGEIDELALKMIFYQEGKLNNLTVRFQYEFTQNQGLKDEATHFKAFDYSIKVRSQSPFQVEWQIKSADCFLSSLQHFYSLHLGTQSELRQFIQLFNRSSIFDQPSSLPIKEEIQALSGEMVASEEQTCWVVCRLTSQAKYRDVSIKNLNLQLNPEIADFVTIVDSVGCETSSTTPPPTGPYGGDGSSADEDLCIEPGETYEVLFKLRIDKIKFNAGSFLDESLNLGTSQMVQGKPLDKTNSEEVIVDQVNLLRKLYQLQQQEIFSELHFQWSSFEGGREDEDDPVKGMDLIDCSPDPTMATSRVKGEQIPCCVGSPPINLVTRPLQVQVKNLHAIETVKLYEPFSVEYKITNLTGKVIHTIAELQTYDSPSKAPFMVAGEIRSRMQLMPTDEDYILKYTLYPQELGSIQLPRLSISDDKLQTLNLIKDFTVKVFVTST